MWYKCYNVKTVKRWKRLWSLGVDRNTASPTESAVWKRRSREHSGADWLNRNLHERLILKTAAADRK